MIPRTRRRRRFIVALAVLGVLLVFAFTDLHWRIYGLFSRDPSFQGLPSSYYASRINRSGWGRDYGVLDWKTPPILVWGAGGNRGSVELWVRRNFGQTTADAFWYVQKELLFERDESAIPVLTHLLSHPDREVKGFALGWLASMGDKSAIAIPDVRVLLTDGDPEVQKWAKRTLESIQTGQD